MIGVSDQQLAQQIAADRIDILFDLAGHTAHNRLLVFARKPAPLQVTWAGYVGTTGLKAMDYLLADRYEVPPGNERHYREQVLANAGRLRMLRPAVLRAAGQPPAGIASRTRNLRLLQQSRQGHIARRSKFGRRFSAGCRARLVLKFKGWTDPGVVEALSRKCSKSGESMPAGWSFWAIRRTRNCWPNMGGLI